MRALLLTDDVHRLDRRILQQGRSLVSGRLGVAEATCDLFGPSGHLEREPLPAGMAWVEVDTARAGLGAARPGVLATAWAVGSRLGLGRPLAAASALWRDPAARLARGLAGRPELRGYDLVVAHSLMLLPAALALRAAGHTGRVVYDAHEIFDEQRDAMPSAVARRYWRRVGDRAIPAADAVITVTPQVAACLASRHGLRQVPAVVYNACPRGTPTASGRLRALYGIPDGPPIVLCQGALQPNRGLEDLVRAAAHLGGEAVVVFLGDGAADYVARLRRLVAPGAPVFVGRAVAGAELLDHTADARLGVITDRGPGPNNSLGGPNRLFEYIQARVPVLSHTHPGVAAVLDRAGVGWTARWSGPVELAEAIRTALGRCGEVDPATREAAAAAWSWEAQEAQLGPALLGPGGRGLNSA